MTALQIPDVGPIQAALGDLPAFLEGPPHVYALCAPRYRPAPKQERALPRRSLRLYVHVPFCRYKCSFCNYAVLATPGGADRGTLQRYVDAVRREIADIPRGTRLTGLFVGGGTPTALPADLLDALLRAVFARLGKRGGGVHTCESSPDTVTPAHAEVMRRRGIDRVSLGVQSLEERVLDTLTRRHSVRQALEAVRALVDTGLDVNVDLIYGLPGQREDDFRRDVLRAGALGVRELTLYALRPGERSAVTGSLAPHERMDLPRLVRWRAVAHAAAAEAGFVQTRWHSFERAESAPSRRRRRAFGAGSNVYQLGVGNSARSHLGARIYANARSPQAYVRRIAAGASPVDRLFELQAEDRRSLYLIGSLGGSGAIDRTGYRRAFGRCFDGDYGSRVERLRAADLVRDDGERIALSDTGRLLDDRVALALYPPRALDALRGEGDRIDARMRAAAGA